jgi:site-specific DNA-methyltransferase (cytosine-N4-specific)
MGKEINIKLELDQYKNNSYLTHNYHPYPAKFIPQIPNELISKLSKKNDWVLDPFCGSGTTLVESKLLNRNAIGVDINPLACLMARVKTKILTPKQTNCAINITRKIINEIRADKVYEIPNFFNINHWFKIDIQKDLSVIRHHLLNIDDVDVKDFLNMAFSSIIVKVSNQESDTRYAAIDKKITPKETMTFFQNKVFDMINRLQEFKKVAHNTKTVVYNYDSTKLDFIKRKVALAVTSPPYMNSYDYYLYHKHRMNWLDLDYKKAQEKEFGSRNKHNDKKEGIESYNRPIANNAESVRKVLRNKGYYCVIVGDAILRKELIRMNKNFDKIFLASGFNKVDEITFNQRKYTRSFTPRLKNVYKNSYILIYQK